MCNYTNDASVNRSISSTPTRVTCNIHRRHLKLLVVHHGNTQCFNCKPNPITNIHQRANNLHSSSNVEDLQHTINVHTHAYIHMQHTSSTPCNAAKCSTVTPLSNRTSPLRPPRNKSAAAEGEAGAATAMQIAGENRAVSEAAMLMQ